MAVTERRHCASRSLCFECHDHLLSALTFDSAQARSAKGDSHVFRFEVCVHDCGRHVGRSCCCWVADVRQRPKTFHLFLTASEVEDLRKSGGAGVYAQAPDATCHANTHLASYRLKGTKDTLVDTALRQTWGWLAAEFYAPSARMAIGSRPGLAVANEAQRCCVPVAEWAWTRCVTRQDEAGLRSWKPVALPTRVCLDVDDDRKASSHVVKEAPQPATPAAAATPASGGPGDVQPAEALHPVPAEHSKLQGVDLVFDANSQHPTAALAVRYLPAIEARIAYLDNLKNIRAAIAGRINDPFVPVSLTDAEKADLNTVVQAFRDYMARDKSEVYKIATSLLFGDIKSKKWTPSRASTRLDGLRATYNPHYTFKGKIKLEMGRFGKAPRLLIADGDEGQVMAWVLIGVLEKWLFKRFDKRAIKGCSASQITQRIQQMLAQREPRTAPGVRPEDAPQVEVDILENDGSAWDACMSEILRALTENLVMDDLAKMLEPLITSENHFTPARLLSNQLKELKLKVKVKPNPFDPEPLPEELDNLKRHGGSYLECIRAIRRSGCRGTSVLNWLGNMLCWCWVIGGADGAKLVVPEGGRVRCVDGVLRWVKMLFEGDDSILSFFTPGNGEITQATMTAFDARWRSLGHRPKLYRRLPGSVAECVGHHFLVDRFGLVEGTGAPDLQRCLCSLSYCCNALAVKSALAGDKDGFARAVAPGLISRAYKLGEAYPSVARWCFGIAKELMGTNNRHVEYTHDDLVHLDAFDFDVLPAEYKADKVSGDERIIEAAVNWQTMLDKTESRISAGLARDGVEETDRAVSLRVAVDDDAWYNFLDVLDNVRLGSDQTEFRAAVAGLLTTGIN